MPNATISQIKVGNTTYDIRDATVADIANSFKIVDCTNSAAVTFAAASTSRQVGTFNNLNCDIVTDEYAITNDTSLQDILNEGFLPVSILTYTVKNNLVLCYAVPYSAGSPFPHMRMANVTTSAISYTAKECVAKTLFYKPSS